MIAALAKLLEWGGGASGLDPAPFSYPFIAPHATECPASERQ